MEFFEVHFKVTVGGRTYTGVAGVYASVNRVAEEVAAWKVRMLINSESVEIVKVINTYLKREVKI